jgi:hypothetical protein
MIRKTSCDVSMELFFFHPNFPGVIHKLFFIQRRQGTSKVAGPYGQAIRQLNTLGVLPRYWYVVRLRPSITRQPLIS